MKKIKLWMWILGIVWILASPTVARERKVLCIFSGGSQGYLDPIKEKGGLARQVTLLQQLRQEAQKKGTFFIGLDSGNTIGPYYYTRLNRGKLLLKVMKELGYTALSPGNNEFDYGNQYLGGLEKNFFPILSANIYKRKTERLLSPYTIREERGLKIGIFGLTSPRITSLILGDHLKAITIKAPQKEATKVVEELKKKGCALIICLGHLDVDEAATVAKRNPSIDLIIRNYKDSSPSGGFHSIVFKSRERRPIVVAPEENRFSVGTITFYFEEVLGQFSLQKITMEHLPLEKKIITDPTTSQRIAMVKKQVEKRGGGALFPYPPSKVLPITLNQEEFAALFAAILRDQLNTEVAVINNRLFDRIVLAELANREQLTYLDLEKIFRAQNYLVKFGLPGSDLASLFSSNNPSQPLSFSGVEKKNGAILVNGVPLKGDSIYWVATTKYLASGSTGYSQFTKKVYYSEKFTLRGDFSLKASPDGTTIPVQEAFSYHAKHILKEIGPPMPYPNILKSRYMEIRNIKFPLYMLVFDNLRLTYSQNTAGASSKLGSLVADTRASAKNQTTARLAGQILFLRHSQQWLWDNKIAFVFAQTEIEGQERNTSEDDLYFETDSKFLGLGYDLTPTVHLVPYLNLKYDTEIQRDLGKALQQEIFLSLGAAGVSSGPLTKIKIGALGRGNFTGDQSTFQFGLVGESEFKHTLWSIFQIESNLLVYYFPNQPSDKAGDLRFRVEWGTIFKIPFFKDFYFILDFRLFAFQEKSTGEFGNHIAFSVGINYYRAWKFLYEPLFGK